MATQTNCFSNDEITVNYDPKCCKNSGICALQLSSVFRTTVIPWIDLDGADRDTIIAQIEKCPSGALSYTLRQKDVA